MKPANKQKPPANRETIDLGDIGQSANAIASTYDGVHRVRAWLAYLIVGTFLVCSAAAVGVGLWAGAHGEPVEPFTGLLTQLGAVFGSLTGAVVVFYFQNREGNS